MNNVLQKIYRRTLGPTFSSQVRYEECVKRLAKGEQFDESELEAVLDGRTPNAMQTDIATWQARHKADAALRELAEQDAKHEAMVAEAKTLQQVAENTPFAKLLREHEAAQAKFAKQRDAAREFAFNLAERKSREMWVLRSTASKAIEQKIAQIQGEAKPLEVDRDRIRLSQGERERYQAAQAEASQLQSRVAALKGQSNPGAAAELASVTARLLGVKKQVADYSERVAEVERLSNAIAKINAKAEKMAEDWRDPENMEFTSKPIPERDLIV